MIKQTLHSRWQIYFFGVPVQDDDGEIGEEIQEFPVEDSLVLQWQECESDALDYSEVRLRTELLKLVFFRRLERIKDSNKKR